MLKRYPDWSKRLADKIEARRSMPFVWGENDCCLFATDCIKAITGQDIAEAFRGYVTQRQALRILDNHGGLAGLAENVTEKYGISEIPPLKAGRGDLCLFDIGRGDTLGIRAGEWIFAPGYKGLIAFPVLQGLRAWRIG